MLKKLEVQNFKNFEHVVLDFGNVGEYNFNEEIIKNGIIILYNQVSKTRKYKFDARNPSCKCRYLFR